MLLPSLALLLQMAREQPALACLLADWSVMCVCGPRRQCPSSGLLQLSVLRQVQLLLPHAATGPSAPPQEGLTRRRLVLLCADLLGRGGSEQLAVAVSSSSSHQADTTASTGGSKKSRGRRRRRPDVQVVWMMDGDDDDGGGAMPWSSSSQRGPTEALKTCRQPLSRDDKEEGRVSEGFGMLAA